MLLEPLKRRQKLSVAIPASIVSDTPHLREKTFRIGFIGRALAVFRVDEVIIYPDILGVDQSRDQKFVSTILSYMETPQYLRKKMFGIMSDLRYAGILPPLRTPHHPTKGRKRDLRVGEFREGVVVKENKRGILVDVGVEDPIFIPGVHVKRGTRVTVKIISEGDTPGAVLVNLDDVPVYWGYNVLISRNPLGQIIKKGSFDLVIATSRYGEPFIKVMNDLLKRWHKSRNILITFGSPTQGLYEIIRQEGLELSEVSDFIINVIPRQATETVRTEEALYATLAILNVLTEPLCTDEHITSYSF
ncbi:MAG: RNA methyltransferase [Candidatus Bathyarchaeia archaeon]|nr:RNA-binding protein [Candidatus Bathyarchaeota archaeon]